MIDGSLRQHNSFSAPPAQPQRLGLPCFTSSPPSFSVRCSSCAFLEIFGEKTEKYWNKCALLDIYNLDIDSEHVCHYFLPVEVEDADESEEGGAVIL